MVDGQPPGGRAGERLCGSGQAAEYAGRSLGDEGRVAGQKLVGAVASGRITATPIPKMGRKAVESNSVFIDNLPAPAEDLVDKLKELSGLVDSGALTKDEFETAKQKLLAG